eukprot:jgi/Bigna1/86900/estExt_fgenesh1_pg.C_140254
MLMRRVLPILFLQSLSSAVWQGRILEPNDAARHSSLGAPMAYLLGGQKCGSSSLFKMLKDYWTADELCSGHELGDEPTFFRKEKHFWSSMKNTSEAESNFEFYMQHFDTCPGSSLLIDGTPNYLCETSSHGNVPQMIREIYEKRGIDYTKLRFAAILRNPVHRAVSYYGHGIRQGWSEVTDKTWEEVVDADILSFKDAVKQDENMIPGTVCRSLQGGLYEVQLRHWFKHFDPSQFLIVTFQQFLKEPAGTTNAVAKHFGLSQHNIVGNADKVNTGEYKRPTVTSKEAEFFEPHQEALFRLKKKYPSSFYETSNNKFVFAS